MICGFLLDVDNAGWFDFIVKCGTCFSEIFILSKSLKKWKEEKFSDILYRVLEYYPIFEKAIEEDEVCDEFPNFLSKDLNNCYSAINELREDIYILQFPKKAHLQKALIF